MKSFLSLSIILFVAVSFRVHSQVKAPIPVFTRSDSLRGELTPLRTCYDINYYHLDVKVNIDDRFISGSNEFKFTATTDFKLLQFDLFANLKIERIMYKGKELPYTREFNAVFVTFPTVINKGKKDSFRVFYSGYPIVAKNAPWDGGFVFSKDASGKPFVATACQGVGASIWWPTKDHQSDEVDSMAISISVPNGLKDVSNGRLRATKKLKDGYTRYDWFVANSINNYDVAINIADYAHFSDQYQGEKGMLSLDYWVLPENLTNAKIQFGENVKPMLEAFEHWFGPYPFYEDGYKLVEAPHLGMEHQSAVAYGNGYKNGYKGRDLSGTGWGLKWDFIIVHESGHEWFGNNITAKDIADMWIHESFTNYSESLFVESRYGKQAGLEYVHGTRGGIDNVEPILGTYGVNNEGSGDMYEKGGNMLNMIRTIINDDQKWLQILRGLNKTFYHQTVTYKQIVDYINKESGKNLTTVFDQYLQHVNIPVLEVRFENGKILCRWIADVKGFDMTVKVRIKGGQYQFIQPGTTFTAIDLPGATKENFEADSFNFYIGILIE
ncbi:Peptidase M1 family protein [Arcticibacter svalbardensis MN12-7]|uniref:Peptidase M1 family protein n=1 Tax=Arcticibacter svalbardensis MN12-7 TaxID=1150600 RepID=R9GWM4_9SPHI|nr:M1 family metallopeptidase [Arcticibacter svalbardensis]EOR93354.1 Peptidase M1 family protein [Arcticibacter svalbardensis MN12-7]